MKTGKLWNPAEDVSQNARTGLPLLADRFFAAGDRAAADDTPPADLHRFRIASKRFRYTLELFREAYGPRLEALIGDVRRVQTLLGESNDCTATLKLLPKQGHDGLRATLEARGEELRRRFRTFWRDRFTSGPVRERWLHYLAVYAGRSLRPPSGR